MITELERKKLKKYLEGRIVDNEDKNHIERFASVGFMTIGYDIDKKKETAQTTNLGFSAYTGELNSIWNFRKYQFSCLLSVLGLNFKIIKAK